MMTQMKKKIAVLGSSGSIGVNTLNVVAQFPERFEVIGLAVQRNITLLEQQIRQFHPQIASVADEALAAELRKRCADLKVEILAGESGAIQVATHADMDMVISAIVGFSGLIPTYRAVLAHKEIALANKETLVAAGALIMPEIARQQGTLLPVDSEHHAIFQCLQGHRREDVHKILLTASGGPFRQFTREQLQSVTVQHALRHPNWAMGKKITIDSATLMNKGLEVIEAHWLFDIAFSEIQVVVHPQSVIHSMVEYVDGSIIAELGAPDMRIPIAYALSYPEQMAIDAPRLDFTTLKALTFEEPDLQKFPCLHYAYQAGEIGATMPTVLNAANEIAVEAFLQKQIGFVDIAALILQVMDAHVVRPLITIEDVVEADHWAREKSKSLLTTMKK
ncbi:1-deoxy-D-xylulose 5-phosphate reductoisomerase [Candidatus Vecturithrix granuli]|uniref:1-deoxy-D-xylulose 5-phosphate reductoisomerase n=1 Tax=Vecturithrix granuli TaxID=1499967 RepID=A0A081BZF2_VECG1|nr:1-deoxy-D-xylulose 5-phosphate reductoisomerase [Candidatus Vecturithrix granuli]